MLRMMLISAVLMTQLAQAESFDHQQWNQLLIQYVIPVRHGQASVVDYSGLAQDQRRLKAYVDTLAAVSQAEFDKWPPDEQLAFLINAYNAWTVKLILTGYPDIESIKDLGSFFSSPWSKSFIPLLGSTRSLDDIEHELIRGSGRYNDPRIHFAVNCASIGCPALRAEAYVSGRLDEQLQDQLQLFLADRTRNRLEQDTLKVSPIFKWYSDDFQQGWLGIVSVQQLFVTNGGALGLSNTEIANLEAGEIDIEYLDYDWQLNASRN